jgi:hypothetical protein
MPASTQAITQRMETIQILSHIPRCTLRHAAHMPASRQGSSHRMATFQIVRRTSRAAVVQVAREGTKKTVFTNFLELCKAMNRQLEHVQAFLLAELGTSGNLDGQSRLVVKGRFLPKAFEGVLRRYVNECAPASNFASATCHVGDKRVHVCMPPPYPYDKTEMLQLIWSQLDVLGHFEGCTARKRVFVYHGLIDRGSWCWC